MAEPALRLEGVVKEFVDGETTTRVLHGLDLTLAEGEFTALVGPSGSGKSTLLNLVGLLDRPTAGKVWVAGVDTGKLDDDALTRTRGTRIGFVFQFHHLLPGFSALENVMIPMMAAKGRPDPGMVECGTFLLGQVGLEEVVDRRASKLSGGQAQRVAIARALAMAPKLVLADEPTGNLDTHSADEIFLLLRAFNRKAGTTFLVVTHDPRLAARCDRIVTLVDGRIVSDLPNAAEAKGAR